MRCAGAPERRESGPECVWVAGMRGLQAPAAVLRNSWSLPNIPISQEKLRRLPGASRPREGGDETGCCPGWVLALLFRWGHLKLKKKTTGGWGGWLAGSKEGGTRTGFCSF